MFFCGFYSSFSSLFVLRVCEYISTLEHTHFSDGASQPSLTITQSQQAPAGLHTDSEPGESAQALTPEQETTLSNNPVIQPVSIQELIKESSKGRAFDFRGGSLLCGTSAAKAVLTLSTQADRYKQHSWEPEALFPQQDQNGPFCGAVGSELCLLQLLASVEFHKSAPQPAVPKRPAGTGGERTTKHGHRMSRLNVPKTQSADRYVTNIFAISAIISTAQTS